MMTIANRLRGTYGWFARVFGLAATIAVYLFSGSWVIAVLIGVGYWLGELWCGWIICADLGYYFRDKIAVEKFGLSYVGGWELQKGFYGVLQDLVFGGIIIWMLMN